MITMPNYIKVLSMITMPNYILTVLPNGLITLDYVTQAIYDFFSMVVGGFMIATNYIVCHQ